MTSQCERHCSHMHTYVLLDDYKQYPQTIFRVFQLTCLAISEQQHGGVGFFLKLSVSAAMTIRLKVPDNVKDAEDIMFQDTIQLFSRFEGYVRGKRETSQCKYLKTVQDTTNNSLLICIKLNSTHHSSRPLLQITSSQCR